MSAATIHIWSTLVQHRWWLCVAAGVLLYWALDWALPTSWSVADKCALAWIIGVAAFLGWTAFDLAGAHPQRLRELARREDPSRAVVFTFALAAALASLIAATVLLPKGGGGGDSQLPRIVLVAGVIAAAWSLMHGMFALHYAHSFYGDGPTPGADDRGGLQFPGDSGHPDILDFLYFSLVIGMTCQVSDVQITGKHMRRLASIHAVLSFFFNTVILAITVNLVVSSV